MFFSLRNKNSIVLQIKFYSSSECNFWAFLQKQENEQMIFLQYKHWKVHVGGLMAINNWEGIVI